MEEDPPDVVPQDVVPQDDEGLSFDLLSASIRADSRDLKTFLEALAVKLEEALPGCASVRREGGLFRRDHPVTGLTLTIEDRVFELQRSAAGLEARVAHQVRGVTLRRDSVGLDAWIEDLSHELARLARSNAQAQQALSKLLV